MVYQLPIDGNRLGMGSNDGDGLVVILVFVEATDSLGVGVIIKLIIVAV